MTHYIYLLFLILFSGCHESTPVSKMTTLSGNAMTISYRILIGHPLSDSQERAAQTLVRSTFEEVDRIYNKWNPQSELSRLNQLPAHTTISISPELEHFLAVTQKVVEISQGRFDPTVEPLQQLWKERFSLGTTPTKEDIAAIIPAIGWDKIHFGNGKFSKDHSATQLDLGGIAKGHCVDLLVERLNAAGHPNVFVEWGGEIRASGQHPDGRPWNIFISRFGDSNPDHAIAHLPLQEEAIATSGDYLQHWTIEKTTYFHIFDPKNYQPLIASSKSVSSASVRAPNCAFADGLATVAMMFPSLVEAETWAKEVQKQHPEVQFWLVSREN